MWTVADKPSSSWTTVDKPRDFGLTTEDLLYFLATEDDEVLLVEPTASGDGAWTNIPKS